MLIFRTFSACCFWCSSKVGFGHPFWAQGVPKWCQRLPPGPKEGAKGAFWDIVGAIFGAFLGREEIAILQYLQCEIMVFEGPGGHKMCTFCDFFPDCVLEVPFLQKITQECHQGGAQGRFWVHFRSLWRAMGVPFGPLWPPFWCPISRSNFRCHSSDPRGNREGGPPPRGAQRGYLVKAK